MSRFRQRTNDRFDEAGFSRDREHFGVPASARSVPERVFPRCARLSAAERGLHSASVVVALRSFLTLAALVGGAVWIGRSQPETNQRPSSEIMWRKLDLSHRVLDALVLDDFEALEAYAQDLASLGEAGEWVVSDSESYTAANEDFQRSAAAIAEAARARHTERAARGYVALTLACVGCHRELSAR